MPGALHANGNGAIPVQEEVKDVLIESHFRMALAHNAKDKLRRAISQKIGELD